MRLLLISLALACLPGCQVDNRTDIQRRKDYESDMADMAHSEELQRKHAENWLALDRIESSGRTKVPEKFGR